MSWENTQNEEKSYKMIKRVWSITQAAGGGDEESNRNEGNKGRGIGAQNKGPLYPKGPLV